MTPVHLDDPAGPTRLVTGTAGSRITIDGGREVVDGMSICDREDSMHAMWSGVLLLAPDTAAPS